jgi:hypothetical protein
LTLEQHPSSSASLTWAFADAPHQSLNQLLSITHKDQQLLPPEKKNLLQQQAQGSINMSGIYSASGFDILQFLERVVNRKNPVVCYVELG